MKHTTDYRYRELNCRYTDYVLVKPRWSVWRFIGTCLGRTYRALRILRRKYSGYNR